MPFTPYDPPYEPRTKIDKELIESIMEPINGIKDLIKDSPEQNEMMHQLQLHKPINHSFKNRA